ncbi:hypothetical protein ACFQ2T_04890 [Methylophilus flavus]|uniref:Uncharacterized protein n=1 Tax=Methylophilus flavus TaxID=640084 RepID=A0ABW3P793_9PROT
MRYLGQEYIAHIDGNQSVDGGKLGRKLHKGGGGDGGAAERKAAEDGRIAAGIRRLNEVFGISSPKSVDKNQFYVTVPTKSTGSPMADVGQSKYTKIFNQAAYDDAVKKTQDEALTKNPNAVARENLYSKIGTDATNVAKTDIDKERMLTERELKFQLARNGLSGGSRDIDANRDVLDTYQQGVLKASNIGTQTANEARSNDEKTRVNLINSIQAGLTSGDAVQQAYAGMANNATAAQDSANAASLTGFFDVLRNQQDRNQYRAGVESVAGQKTKPTYNSSATANYGGTVRSA